MNWIPDRLINYEDAEITPNKTVMIQSNYEWAYTFWTFQTVDNALDPYSDVAIWRLKKLK